MDDTPSTTIDPPYPAGKKFKIRLYVCNFQCSKNTSWNTAISSISFAINLTSLVIIIVYRNAKCDATLWTWLLISLCAGIPFSFIVFLARASL